MAALGVITNVADDTGATWALLDRQQKFDMEDTIHQLEPDAEPYVRMQTHPDFNSKPARAQKVEWLEDELMPRIAAAALGATAGSATVNPIPVATGFGTYFRTNDIVRNEATGELILVASVSGDNVTWALRGVGAGGTGTTFVATSDVLVIVSNASFEGAGMSDIRMTKKVAQSNFTQIFRKSYGFTETVLATDMYGPAEPAGEARKKMLEYRRDWEHAAFVGLKDIRKPANQHPQSFMGGLLSFISAAAGSTSSTAATITVAALETFLIKAFRYGSKRKVAFCSPIFQQAISQYSAAKMALSNWGEGSVYGVATTRYRTSLGDELLLIVHRDWGDMPNAAPGMGGTMFVVDMANVSKRPLRNTYVKTNIQANDADQRIDEIISETSMQVVHSRTHAIWQGATGIS
jgi:hypothetical protein